MYAWLPLAEPEARPLRRAMGALLRELDDAPPDDVTDIPELQVRVAHARSSGHRGPSLLCFGVSMCCRIARALLSKSG